MEQVADGVFRLGTRGHNFYVIVDGTEATMIDAGCSREWKDLVAGLEPLGLGTDAVSGMVATHAHADHFGLASALVDKGVSVSVHDEEHERAVGTYDGRFAVSPSEIPMFRIHTLRNFLPMVRAGVLKLAHPEIVGTFSDGDRLDLAGSPVAIHTPGHTEGHVMFHCPDLGVLFTGDGIVTMDLTGPSTGPQLIGDIFSLDPKQALSSLDRVAPLAADLLLPGHGKPWHGSPSEAAALARSAAQTT